MVQIQCAGLADLITKDEYYAARYEQHVHLVSTLSDGELPRRFPKEHNSWRSRKSWAKSNGVTWAADLRDFRSFLMRLGPIPEDSWTLDRVDPTGGYVLDNLRWADKTTQSRNRTNIPRFLIHGAKRTYREIAQLLGKSVDAVRMQIKRNGIDSVIQALLPAKKASKPPATLSYEEQWDFPEEYRHALQIEYVNNRKPGENRITFFIRFMKSELWQETWLRYRELDSTTTSDLELVKELHDKAVVELQIARKKDRHSRLYGHINVRPTTWTVPDDHPEFVASEVDRELWEV